MPASTLATVADSATRAVLSPAFRLVFRLEIANRPGMFAQVALVIGARGCSLGAIDLVEATPAIHVRDVTVDCPDERTGEQLHEDLRAIDGVRVRAVSDRAFLMHLGGKIETRGRVTGALGPGGAGGSATAWKLLTACGTPSSSTVKSARPRPATAWPDLSTATTSTVTSSIPAGNAGGFSAGVSCGLGAACERASAGRPSRRSRPPDDAREAILKERASGSRDRRPLHRPA